LKTSAGEKDDEIESLRRQLKEAQYERLQAEAKRPSDIGVTGHLRENGIWVAVDGDNDWSGSCSEDLAKVLRDLKYDRKRIKAVALTERDFAVVTDTEKKWSVLDSEREGFAEKMHAIPAHEIKQIAFGPTGSWAIVKENGCCEHWTKLGKGNIWEAIESKKEEKIKYVGFGKDANTWIVGFGRDGRISKGLHKELKEQLQVLKNDEIQVDEVIIGPGNMYIIRNSYGVHSFCYNEKSALYKQMGEDARLVAMWK